MCYTRLRFQAQRDVLPSFGATVTQWRSGAVMQWRNGAVAQWRSGEMAQWLSDGVVQ